MKPTLLIAEADKELRDAYRMFFKIHNYEAIMTTDGLDCLLSLRRVKPVVLLLDTDLRWGGSDGVLDALRTEDPVPWVPVILTTTGETYRNLADLVRPPVVRCLRKPFSLKMLLESVRSARAEGQRRAALTERRLFRPYYASGATSVVLAKR
jgi:DNA-binding NtrC family response regulator